MIWRVLLFELVLLLVIAGVWLGAPLIGIKSVLWRVLIIIALVLPPLIVLIWRLIERRRAARKLESAMQDQARAHQETVRPDKRPEIVALNDAFAQAMTGLKKSRLGGSGRGSALYALPWYMIIGPPAAGKSTALLRSGLSFPFTPGERKAIRGVGGTRNCDWWFSDQAILLDTAGRYTSEDDDRDEWLAFLRMVRRYRRRRPLNGLIVAVSIADVVTARADELEELAGKIRSRIDQVIHELRLALPIYLIFTKCDLVAGFVEFFGDLTKTGRSQVLGFTASWGEAIPDVAARVRDEVDLLTRRLRKRAMLRLSSARTQQRNEIYEFPLQFAMARDQVAAFTAQLMVSNPYQEAPALRGVYFCSGTQEGRPINRVIGAMSRALGLREIEQRALGEQPAKKSYFLRDVFTRVMFPDQKLVGLTASALRRRRRLLLAGAIVATLSSIALLGSFITSFINNRALVSGTVDLAKRSRILTPDDPRRVADSLKALDRLGGRVDMLRGWAKKGTPWLYRFGYYQGDALFEPAQAVYIKRMRQAFVRPTGTELEASLVDIAAVPDVDVASAAKDFDLLKAYLMVTEPQRLKIDQALPVLLGQWRKRLHPEVAQEQALLERNVKRYLRLLAARKAIWLDRDNDVVRNVRQALRARDAEYRSMIGPAARSLQPMTLQAVLRNRVQTAITATYKVPGAYTRTGWSRFMRKRLAKNAVAGSGIEPWVLGEEEGAGMSERLRRRYYDQYVAAWQRFLRGVTVKQPMTAQEALALLERLTEPPSLIEELFRAVDYNTQIPLVELPSRKVMNEGRRLLRGGRLSRAMYTAQRLGLDKAAGDALSERPTTPVAEEFWPLHQFVAPTPGADGRAQVSGLSQYLAQLEAVRDALAAELKGSASSGGAQPGGVRRALDEAQRVTKGVLATLPGDLRRLLEPFLSAPFELAGTTSRAAAADRSARSFSNELCAAYQEKLAGRYPFSHSKRDALMQDVVEFFAPHGIVWTYYEANLQAKLPRRGDRFDPTEDGIVPAPIVSFINRAWKVSRAIFPYGSETPGLRFEVRPQPAILANSAGVQISEIVFEVDGKARTYRNGPPEQWSMTWRGQGGRARLLVRGAGGLREELSYEGDWALLRLIDRGKVRKRGSWYEVEWSLRGGAIRIPMQLQPARTTNMLFDRPRLECH